MIKKRTVTLLDSVALIGLFVYVLAMLLDVLRFGREMGDLAYYAILTMGTILLLFFYFLKLKGIWKKRTEVITALAFILLVFIFYYSSFGRGPDHPWNGKFFG